MNIINNNVAALVFIVCIFFCIFSITSGSVLAASYDIICQIKSPTNWIVAYNKNTFQDEVPQSTTTCSCSCPPIGVQKHCCLSEGAYTWSVYTDDLNAPENWDCPAGAMLSSYTATEYYFKFDSGIAGASTPRCNMAGITDTASVDWNTSIQYPATASDPSTCYDWYPLGQNVWTKQTYAYSGKRCLNTYTVNYDSSQDWCDCYTGANQGSPSPFQSTWALGCTSGSDCASNNAPNACCGDNGDANEFAINCLDNCPSANPECQNVFCRQLVSSDPPKARACCFTTTDCVYNDWCYRQKEYQVAGSEWRCDPNDNRDRRWRDVVGPTSSIEVTGSKTPGKFYDSGSKKFTGSVDVKLDYNSVDQGSGLKNWIVYEEGTPEPAESAWTVGACSGTNVDFRLTSGDGEKKVLLKARDRTDNITTVNDSVTLDTAPPGPPVRIPEERGWSNSKVSVMVSYNDISGISEGKYCWTPDEQCAPTNQFTLGLPIEYDVTGNWTLCTNATDNVGNQGGPHCSTKAAYKIDKIPPVTSITSPTAPPGTEIWRGTDFDVFFRDFDQHSGADLCYFKVYNSDVNPNSVSFQPRLCSDKSVIPVGAGKACSKEGHNTCVVEAYARDYAGNEGNHLIAYFSIDMSPPSCVVDSISEVNNPDCQFVSGKDNVFYSNNNAVPSCSTGGIFQVNVIANDPESGVKNVSFPLTVSPGTYDTDSPYYHTYGWISSSTFSSEIDGPSTVICYGNTEMQSTATFSVYRDVTPPAGDIDYPDGFWNQTLPTGELAVPINLGLVLDPVPGSGIDVGSNVIKRRSAVLSGGACIGVWDETDIVPAAYPAFNDASVESGKCYRYSYLVSDNVKNTATITSVNVTKVDNDPPDNPPVTDQGAYSAVPSLTFTATYPNSNPSYRPDMESGLSNCYIEIATDPAFTQASIADSGKIITGGGMVGTYTFNGGEDSKTYYARVKCDDQAGNMNFTYSVTDGITVDTSIPQIPVVNDIRGPGQTDDVDTISSTEVAWVYWRAVDTGSPIVREEYSLYEYVQDGSPVSLTGWIQSVPSGPTAMGGGYATMDMRTNTGEVNLTKLHQANPAIPEQMSNGKHYFFKVNVTDSVGHWNVSTSDGFMISACDGQPCGKTCELNNQQGACNGLGVCYVDGGCGLSCSLPAGWRACYDNDNNKLPDCNPLRNNPLAYCKRTGATRCGAGSLCLDSVTTGHCLDPFTGSGGPVDMTGSWTTYQVSDPTKFYGPNNPVTVQVGGIGSLSSSFEPLLECTLESPLPGKYYYLDRWGKMDALLSFKDFPLNSDGQWNLTKCALKTDYDENKGWDMKNDSTIYRFNIDTTKPAASIKGPVGKIGIRFNITWEGVDPVVNGMKSDVDYYYVEYVDKSEVVGNIIWQGDETTKIRANYLEVVLPSSKVDAQIAVYCFRVKAVDNAGNAGDWSCEPLDSGSPNERFASCDCAALDTQPPGGIWVSTAPKFSNAPVTSISVDWGAAPSGGSGSAMAASGFRTMAVPEGTQCFEVDYRVTDNTGKNLTPGNGWVQWGAINDRYNVPIWEGGSSYRTIDCTTQNNVIFSPRNVIGEDAENRAYFFRVRAVGDINGYAPVSNWTETTEGSMIDRTKPDVDLSAIRRLDGSPIPEGDTILTKESVSINVTGDPLGIDFTGANSSWIVWKKISTSGYSDEGRYYCPAGSATCTTRDPWNVLDGDYNVSYQGFSMDRAGNVGRSTVDSFNARAPLGLVTSIRELYLVLGSFEHATIQVSNRQNVNEDISLMLQGDYKYSKFLDVTGGELSLDKRTLNITLLPLETKTATIIVYTGDICEACEMNVTAESRIHDDINSTIRMRINVVFPAEFSGLSTPGLVLLMALAALAYMRFGARKQE